MDKNFLRTSGTAILLGVVAIGLRKWYKSIEKKLDQERDAINQDLEDLGVPAEKLREEMETMDEGGLVKALAIGTMFNPDWDMDVVDPDRALESSPIISVTQETFVGRNNQESKDLVFYFDLPDYTKGLRTPKVGDYVTSLKDAMIHAENTIVKFCPKPKGRLIGLISVSYTDPEGKEKTDRVEITDQKIYEELADEYHDGLAPFYEGIVKKTLPDSVLTKLDEWVDKTWSKMKNVKVVEITLSYRMSFKLQDQSGIGINFRSAMETLKYFTEELEIKNRKYNDSSKAVTYRNILFCAPGDTGNFELTSYYYVNSDNKIDINSFSY